MKRFLIPAILVVFGAGWLLAELQVFNLGQMTWTLGLLFAGVAIYAYLGFDKNTFVLGGFFIASSVLSVLRYGGHIDMKIEIPLLVIIIGLLMAVKHSRLIPAPKNQSD